MFLSARIAPGQAFQRIGDALGELVVHGLFFAAPVGRAAQDHGFFRFRVAGELDFDTLLNDPPAARGSEFGAELLQFRLRRSDDVAPSGLAQPRKIVGAGHAAIGDPDAAHGPVARLHRVDDRLQSLRIVGIAGKDFVAQRKAVEAHHKADANLFAVGTMIAGIAAPCLAVGFRLSFEVGARHIVEQHLVLDGKQFAAVLR